MPTTTESNNMTTDIASTTTDTASARLTAELTALYGSHVDYTTARRLAAAIGTHITALEIDGGLIRSAAHTFAAADLARALSHG